MSADNRIALGIGLALALLLGPESARAISYTIPVAIHMDDGIGNVLDLQPVYDDSGGQSCLDGDCSGPDFLIFEVVVTSGAFEEILASALPIAPQGLGYLAGAGTIPGATSAVVGGGGRFDFDSPNLSGQSVRLFSNFASLAGALSTSFSATPVGQPLFNEPGGIVQIPEPSPAALSALGLVAFAAGRRLRRRL